GCAAGIGTCSRVVPCRVSGTAVRTVDGTGARVASGPRVVARSVSVTWITWVIRWIESAPVVRRIVVTAAPHRTAPCHHHSAVGGRGLEFHGIIVIILNSDVGYVVRWRADRDRIDLFG